MGQTELVIVGRKVLLRRPADQWEGPGWPAQAIYDYFNEAVKARTPMTVANVDAPGHWFKVQEMLDKNHHWWLDAAWAEPYEGSMPVSLIEPYYPAEATFKSIADCCGGWLHHKNSCRYMPPPPPEKTWRTIHEDDLDVGNEVRFHQKNKAGELPESMRTKWPNTCASCISKLRTLTTRQTFVITEVRKTGQCGNTGGLPTPAIIRNTSFCCWLHASFFSLKRDDDVGEIGSKLVIPTTETFSGKCDACDGQKHHRLGCPTMKGRKAGV